MTRLAIIVSHPTQYYSPWFSVLAAEHELTIKVFYLWDFGITDRHDPKFDRAVKWDLPLLEGYDYEFVPNASRDPGTHRFSGLNNPRLGQQVAQFQPDAVLLFGHGWRSMVEFLSWRRPRGVPVLFRGDSHLLGRGVPQWKAKLKFWATSKLLSGCAGFLAVGSANADYYRALGISAEKIFHVPHCVDNARFQRDSALGVSLREELNISADARIALFAGKFEAKKRPIEVLDAFLEADVPDSILIMAGSGALEESLKKRAHGKSQVRFLPFQNQTAMPRLYAAADLYVLFSYGPSETWGLAVNEAMNCGCGLILSTHVGCAQNLLIDGQNGRLVEAGDREALTATFRQSLSDRNLLASWKHRSKEIIEAYSYAAACSGLKHALKAVRSNTAADLSPTPSITHNAH